MRVGALKNADLGVLFTDGNDTVHVNQGFLDGIRASSVPPSTREHVPPGLYRSLSDTSATIANATPSTQNRVTTCCSDQPPR